jgi:hypothetical protein
VGFLNLCFLLLGAEGGLAYEAAPIVMVTATVSVLLSVSFAEDLRANCPSHPVLVVVANAVDGDVTVSSTVEVTVGIFRYEEQKAVASLISKASTASLIPSQTFEGIRSRRLDSSMGEAVVSQAIRAKAANIQLLRFILEKTSFEPEIGAGNYGKEDLLRR